jgi:hypothetical protein
MIGAFPLMIIIGTIFGKIGDNTPIIKTFLGGGAIVIIFGLAALFDRTIRGFTLSAYRETVHTTIPAVNMAFKNRPAQEGLLFHSDRGGGTVRNLFQRGCGNGVLRSDSA